MKKNLTRDELLNELKTILSLINLSYGRNAVWIEFDYQHYIIYILIKKFSSHGQGNTAVNDFVRAKNSFIYVFLKIEPIKE